MSNRGRVGNCIFRRIIEPIEPIEHTEHIIYRSYRPMAALIRVTPLIYNAIRLTYV